MSTSVSVNTYTYSVTFVADNVQRTLKDIIVQSGLDPTKYVNSWKSVNLALTTWVQSKHLKTIILEIFNPKDDTLVGRWDIEISYGWSSSDTGSFWIDTDQIKTAIRKCGAVPSSCLSIRSCSKTHRDMLRLMAGRTEHFDPPMVLSNRVSAAPWSTVD